jgi:hypothetical protein
MMKLGSGTVKVELTDEPVDESDECRKKDGVDDNMYNFHTSTTSPLGTASTTRLVLGLNLMKFHSNSCNI